MTTNAVDASGYYKNISNTETVTLIIKRMEGETPLFVAGALGINLSLRDANALGVQAGTRSKRWHLPNVNMQGQEAEEGDVIRQSDGTNWTILQSDLQTFGSRWECVTVKERTDG